ncbi:hypothetical protein Pelo_2068 [Pelomyxa schiedti]|nr:hypothetical protein Pelo_2068 [Pelomyxa schiedti]
MALLLYFMLKIVIVPTWGNDSAPSNFLTQTDTELKTLRQSSSSPRLSFSECKRIESMMECPINQPTNCQSSQSGLVVFIQSQSKAGRMCTHRGFIQPQPDMLLDYFCSKEGRESLHFNSLPRGPLLSPKRAETEIVPRTETGPAKDLSL